jgi:hypothetical protein
METMRTRRQITTIAPGFIQDVHSLEAVWVHPVTREVHRAEDLELEGPSLPRHAWENGVAVPYPRAAPAQATPRQPVIETYAPLDTTGLVVAEQARRQAGGMATPPPTPSEPDPALLRGERGVPPLASLHTNLDEAIKAKQERGW